MVLPMKIEFLSFFLAAILLSTSFATADNLDRSNNNSPTSSQVVARPQIIKISNHGVSPSQLIMKQSDSVVFFYNITDEDLLTLEIDFGSRTIHCSAALRTIKPPGLTQTRKPFGPKEFASTCFHEKGSYPYRVLGSQTQIMKGIISVE